MNARREIVSDFPFGGISQPIEIDFSAVNTESAGIIDGILDRILAHAHQSDLKASICFALCELVSNALRANAKRVYLDAARSCEDITSFRAAGVRLRNKPDLAEYMSGVAQRKGLYVKVQIRWSDRCVKFCVVNNSLMERDEVAAVRENLSNARTCDDILEFQARFARLSEGEGLGLALVVICLKNEGLSPPYVCVSQEGKVTRFSFEVPFERDPARVILPPQTL